MFRMRAFGIPQSSTSKEPSVLYTAAIRTHAQVLIHSSLLKAILRTKKWCGPLAISACTNHFVIDNSLTTTKVSPVPEIEPHAGRPFIPAIYINKLKIYS